MPHPYVHLAASGDGLLPGIDGMPVWLVVAIAAAIIGVYLLNSRSRREAARRHLTRDQWEAELRANDPDLKKEDRGS